MDVEKYGLYGIFMANIILILLLSYCAIPSTGSHGSLMKTSLKAQTKNKGQDHLQDDSQQAGETQNKKSAGQVSTPHSTDFESKVDAKDAGIIAMNNPIYEKHKKGIVQFPHGRHIKAYNIECGSCHHDDKGQPLALKETDIPQNCSECHKETIKTKDEKIDKNQKIVKYHFEALHANCIGCHKGYNVEKGDPNGKKPAPVSCTKCHPKAKK